MCVCVCIWSSFHHPSHTIPARTMHCVRIIRFIALQHRTQFFFYFKIAPNDVFRWRLICFPFENLFAFFYSFTIFDIFFFAFLNSLDSLYRSAERQSRFAVRRQRTDRRRFGCSYTLVQGRCACTDLHVGRSKRYVFEC